MIEYDVLLSELLTRSRAAHGAGEPVHISRRELLHLQDRARLFKLPEFDGSALFGVPCVVDE